MIWKFFQSLFFNKKSKSMEHQSKMKISDRGLELIQRSEGLVYQVYKDQAGLDTIGYGHLLTEAEKKNKTFSKGLTAEEATELLKKDVEKAEHSVLSLVKVSLNQNQFDALVDFTFNLGEGKLKSSTLLKHLNAGKHHLVPTELLKWCKAKNPKTGQLTTLPGLFKRRQREVDLWNEPMQEEKIS